MKQFVILLLLKVTKKNIKLVYVMKNKPTRSLKPIICTVCGIFVGIIIWSAITTFTEIRLFPWAETEYVCAETAGNAELTLLAYAVLETIRDNDFGSLSEVVHPGFGLIFTPYTTINLATDRRFSVAEVQEFATNTTTYIWGVQNGTGELISMTPTEYLEHFAPAEDFLEASIVGINKIVRTGNALENIEEIFPEASFVDFHLPGSEEDIYGMDDWRSLRLGFEEYEGELKLVVIIHSAWTA